MARSVFVPRDALDVAYIALDDDDDPYYYENLLAFYAHSLCIHWPSMRPLDRRTYYGREGRILAENRLCRIGESSYGTMLALWIVPQEDAPQALAERWARSIGPTFVQYGTHFCGGTMSNGESFYYAIKETKA